MIPEPLKGKVPEWELPTGKVWIVDVRSAVEWLMQKMDNHRKSNQLWRLPEDESWSMAENWIEEAFEDVMKKDEGLRCQAKNK